MGMQKKLRNIPERLNPGDSEPRRCSPGSIEQKLDMCEAGDLRGDEILHQHGMEDWYEEGGDPNELNEMLNNFHVDMSEEGREGDEMSGDDHSFGLQGGEFEIEGQKHIQSGTPGQSSPEAESGEVNQITRRIPRTKGLERT